MGLRAISPFHRHRRNRDLPLKRPGLGRVVAAGCGPRS